MTHAENSNLYRADEGRLFVRKSDGFVMGDGIDLGVADSIDNYEEREFTPEEIEAFLESVTPGRRLPRVTVDRAADVAGDGTGANVV